MSISTNDLDELNRQCNEGVLADVAALAQQVGNPVEPYPLLFSLPGCGATASGVTSVTFPKYFYPQNCAASGILTYKENCYRIVDFNPLDKTKITSEQMNDIRGLVYNRDNYGSFNGDSWNGEGTYGFTMAGSLLKSYYVPPQFRFYFFRVKQGEFLEFNPQTHPYIIVEPGEVVPASELYVNFSDGKPWIYQLNNAEHTQCATSGCSGATIPMDIALVIQRLPNRTMNDMIIDMCLTNTSRYTIGTNSLLEVWSQDPTGKRESGCNEFMKNFCKLNNYQTMRNNKYKHVCDCFLQQEQLDEIYGKDLNVPVYCFGVSLTGDPTEDCFNNAAAYKTNNMIKSGCSFAECEQTVLNSPDMQDKSPTPGKIQCDGKFVVFPTVVKPDSSGTKSIVKTKSEIPLYVWVIFGIALALLVIYIITLSFVQPKLLKQALTNKLSTRQTGVQVQQTTYE